MCVVPPWVLQNGICPIILVFPPLFNMGEKVPGDFNGFLVEMCIRDRSWAKTNLLLAADGNDSRIAGLMTDGCNMGVKSLNKYLNQYEDVYKRQSSPWSPPPASWREAATT